MAPRESNDLEFNVSGLLRGPIGDTRTYDILEPRLALDEELRASDIAGDVRLLRITSGVLAEGALTAEVTLECSRCLTQASTSVSAPIEEEYRPRIDVVTGAPAAALQEGEVEGDFSWLSPNHILDLTETVRQSILVSLPQSPLCRENCAGLCPTCGKDLNLESCDCAHQAGDPRLAGLAQLLERLD
ncbi:MAG: DUF177 domain-containing protein [Chloroflexota bacterium]|nr:DUF177 domain-containing protein [Chloroflexota bacterium]